MERYRIGDVIVTWKEGNFPLLQDEFMQQFLMREYSYGQQPDEIVYQTQFEDLSKYSTANLLLKNGLYELYDTNEGKVIVYHWAQCRFAFGFKLEELKERKVIPSYFHIDMEKQIPLDAVRFFSCAGLHSKMLQRGALVFHSSYIDWHGRAVLFAGKSGVGKSTQAKLWQNYEGAEIINGDRSLLRCKNGVWHAFGYPCSGSSRICINRTLPLAAIVLLEHGEENIIQHLTAGQKFRAILSGSELYLWDNDEINMIFHIAENIINSIPILKFICTPDENAVYILKKIIEGY